MERYLDMVKRLKEERGDSNQPVQVGQTITFEIDFLGASKTIIQRRERVDSELAQQYLAKGFDGQRSIAKAHVSRLVEAMNSNEFVPPLSGPIVFSDEDKLLNGQHRLTAITHTGKEFWLDVQYGYPREAYTYIDAGRSRTLQDTFSSAGIKNAKKASSAAKLLYSLIEGENRVPRNEVALRMVQDYPEFGESVNFGVAEAKHTHITATVGAVMHFLYTPEYKYEYEKAISTLKFWGADDKGNIKERPKHPIVSLDRKLRKAWKEGLGYSSNQALSKNGTSPAGKPAAADWPRLLAMSWIHQAVRAYIKGVEAIKWRSEADIERVIAEIREMAVDRVRIRHDHGQVNGHYEDGGLPF
jgi:hypothetical protein